MAEHRPVHVLIILLSFLSMIATIVFHYAAIGSVRELLQIPNGWYLSNASVLYERYKIPMTPSYWTTYVWIVVFAFQVMWLSYALTLLCRTTADKRTYLYDQGFTPVWLFVFFLLALVCHLGFVFAYDRRELVATTFMYLLVGVSLVIALAFSYSSLYGSGGELLRSGFELDVTLTRALVQNGLSMYMAWSCFQFTVGLATNLHFQNGLVPNDATSIGLGVLLTLIVLYSVLDILVRSKYMCYTFSAYLVGMVGLIGILTENYVAWERNSVLTCIVLALTLLAFGIKVAFTMWRWRSCPEPIMCSEEMKRALAKQELEQHRQQLRQPPAYPWYQPEPVYYMLPEQQYAYLPPPTPTPTLALAPAPPPATTLPQAVYALPAESSTTVQVLNQVPSLQPPVLPQVQPQIIYQTTPSSGWTGWVS